MTSTKATKKTTRKKVVAKTTKKFVGGKNAFSSDNQPENRNTFSSENQPKNRGKINPISGYLREYGDAHELNFIIELTTRSGQKKVIKADLKSDKTINQAVAAQLLQKALAGDLMSIKEVMDRTEGKSHQHIDLDLSDKRDSIDAVQKLTEELQGKIKKK